MANANSIPVLDSTNKVISKTTSAKARILIKKNKASIFSKDPFMIKLLDSNQKESVMFKGFFDFSEYFKEEKSIYVQNVSNTLVSMEFKTAGGTISSITIPNTPKPFCITDYVSFDQLKASFDLRRLVNREPRALRLMSKEEYVKYYECMAEMNETSLEEELDKARIAHAGIVDRNKLYPTSPKDKTPTKTTSPVPVEKVEVEEQPSPQVVGLCARVSNEVDEDERMGESDFLERLMSLPELREVDLDYLQGHGNYKKVKTWAAKKLESLSASKKSA